MTEESKQIKKHGNTKFPNGFDDQMLNTVEAAAGIGLTIRAIAGLMNIGKTAFYEYMKAQPEIMEAVDRGKSKIEYKVGKALVERAVKGDVNAIRWYEMTRTDRKEAVHVETEERMVVGMPNGGKQPSVEDWSADATKHVDEQKKKATIDHASQEVID